MDDVVANAQAAAATPADGPPAEQQDTRPYPVRWAEAKQAETDTARTAAVEKLSPVEQKIATLRKHPAFYDKNHPDNAKVMAEYRKALAEGDTPEERQTLVDSGVKGAREVFSLDVPRDIAVLGKDVAAVYEEQYANHEAELLRHARSEGWDKSLASDLRDYGVRLGIAIGDRGTPMTVDEVAEFKRTFNGRLTETQQDRLLKWFQQNVVGGAP
jgi:hypothetical protein